MDLDSDYLDSDSIHLLEWMADNSGELNQLNLEPFATGSDLADERLRTLTSASRTPATSTRYTRLAAFHRRH